MNADALLVQQVSYAYGALPVLQDIDIEIAGGEFLAVVGPSGCGKTTLLNLLSGNAAPSTGTIRTQGIVRQVFQQDGLFPWLTVAENIGLGLRFLPDARERADQMAELFALIRLEGFSEHYPYQLSGGMRQRVEIARALAGRADILLMDEPFSALDYQNRLRMRRELVRILSRRPCTVVFVTHDVEEATQLADRVIVLSERPARIQCELHIDLPRPREVTHPAVIDAVRRILGELGLEENAPEVSKLNT